MKKAKVTLKVKGKTYAAKTNSKGKATFKITKLTKKGTYKAITNSKNVIVTTDLELNNNEDEVIIAYGDKAGYAEILAEGELGDNQYRITTNSTLIKLIANDNNTYSIGKRKINL